MKIMFDGRSLFAQREETGVNEVTRNLIDALVKISPKDDIVVLHNFFRSRNFEWLGKIQIPGTRQRLIRFPHVLFDRAVLDLNVPIDLLSEKFDIFHSACYFLPNSFRGRKVLTIHDMYNKTIPDMLDPWWVDYLNKYLQIFIDRCDAVIAISEVTKKDILEYCDCDPQKVHMIHIGCAPFEALPHKEEARRWVSERYFADTPHGYILFIGQLGLYKNLVRVLEAFSIVKERLDVHYKLVLAGPDVWGSRIVHESIMKNNLQDDVITPGYLPRREVGIFYAGAEVLVFPSLQEGFGIPVLEAMSAGVPVLTSDISIMREVTGDAALLVDPYSVEAIAGGLISLLTDDTIRNHYIQKGNDRYRQFSWAKTAKEVLELYRSLI